MTERVLITGTCGFIGYHLCRNLIDSGFTVSGIDSINDYYDPSLKKSRLQKLRELDTLKKRFNFYKLDVNDKVALQQVFRETPFDIVIHLAAQAGVRYSIENPYAFSESNLSGFLNVLECCRQFPPKHFIFASSSSVYGMNHKVPFSEEDNTDYPVSLYAATKKSNELMAHAYSHLFKIPTTGLRFFTVYGPFGRPDMAYFKFTKAILEKRPIEVFNRGDMERDFTYISDIVEGIRRLISKAPFDINTNISNATSPYRVFNIGNNRPVRLSQFINAIEEATGMPAIKKYLPMQKGDVPVTYADIDDLMGVIGFAPRTTIEEGMKKFVQWYREYYDK